jgi:adenosine deaminase
MVTGKKANHAFIDGIPKAELHVHLEGTLEPAMLFDLAQRNKVKLKYRTIEELRNAYEFQDLRDFLKIYTDGTRVLHTSADFYEITRAYLAKCREQNVWHSEIFIDFQTYMKRHIPPDVQMEGIEEARKEALRDLGVSSQLILCFLRHLGPEAAESTLDEALRFREQIVGIGLASTENGYPPELFSKVFDRARKEGFKLVAHAGEEGPWEYVEKSLDVLKIDRIDHGNRSCDNRELVQRIIRDQIPLTLCPLSNIKLKNVDRIENHTAKKMLDLGMMITINSDDPAYFGGYVNENYHVLADAFNLTETEIARLAGNSIQASFITEERRSFLLNLLADYTGNRSV